MSSRPLLAADEQNLASRLNRRIAIEQPVSTADDLGGVTRTWANVASIWAEIMPYSGDETLRGQQLTEAVTHRITIRYRSGITAAMRVNYNGRIFNIRTIANPGEANKSLVIIAQEGVGI